MPTEPYLVTLGFDHSTFERLDRARSHYFPPERNQVVAHLSLFHQLPGDEWDEIDQALAHASEKHASIPLSFPALKRTGGGFLAVVEAPGLASIRASLYRTFSRWLCPQDRQPFTPHVMIMNKAERPQAESAFLEASASWVPIEGRGESLILWRYLGGPWEEVETYRLRGVESVPATLEA